MTADQTNAPPPPSGPAFRRTGLIAASSFVIALSAGVVLAQVLQQPKLPPAAPAQPVHQLQPVHRPEPVKFDAVTVRSGEIQETVEAAGKLQLHEYADVHAQVAGQIKDVLAAIGDTVKSGDMVLEITPTLQPAKAESNLAQMARLQAELADQRAQLDFAQLQFKRQTQLKAQNATREDAYESSRMSVSSARARMDAIEAQIRQLEASLKMDEEKRQHTQVLAPISGTVVALNARPGQMVSVTQAAAPLLRIADLSKMTVQARVAEIDVTRLRRGMTAKFTTPGYPGQQWSGKLRQVIPVPADGSGEHGKPTFYNVLFEVGNAEHKLMSGMSTQVQFILAQAQDAVLMPMKLLGSPDADGLYSANVLDAKRRLSARKLKIGIRNREQAQVLSGLAAGEQLLVGPVPAVLLKQEQAHFAPTNSADAATPVSATAKAGNTAATR